MKKFTKVFVVICVMMALVLSLVACATSGTNGKDEQGRFKLLVPEVTISNNHVSWKAVRYCTTYGVKIDDEEEIRIDRTFYTLAGDKDVTNLTVRSIGDDETTVSSEYSKAVSYKAKTRLANPQQPDFTISGDNIVLNWNSVPNANLYTIERSQSIKEGITTYKSDTNSISISKDDLKDPDVYYFRVRSENNSGDFLRSDFSVRCEYKTTKTLQEISAKFDGSSITWETVEDATSYEIYLEKVAGDGANNSKLVVSTLTSSKSYSSSQISSAVTKYKEEWEKRNKGQTIELAGEYKIYMKAINANYPQIYIAPEQPTLIKKVTTANGEEKVEDITFKKPGKVSEVKVGKQTVTTTDDNQVEVDMLTWTCADYSKFKLKFYSNESNLIDTNVNIEDGDNKDNLTSRFSGSEHAGKVVEISVTVQSDIANGILEGEETYWTADSDINQRYCFVPSELKQSSDEKFKDYYQIENIGGLKYMIDNADQGKKFYLTKNLDGLRSSKNCNFYISDKVFNGIFDGNGFAISNINFIVDEKMSDKSFIGLVKEIAQDAIIKNVTFNNVTITSEDAGTSVALLAKTNKGTVEGVNIVSSKFNVKNSVAGFVLENNSSIKACAFLDTTITAVGYEAATDGGSVATANSIDAAAITLQNNGEIFNISIYDSEINASSRYATVRAGGIAMQNNGSISNSFLREDLVVARTSADGSSTVYAIAGGIAAINAGGNISQCYVSHRASSTKAVEAISNRAAGTSAEMNATAGGLVGLMNGGIVDSCYVAFAKISSNRAVSGLIGDKNDEAIAISNSYAYNLTFEQATDRAMVLTKTDGVTATNVYAYVGDVKQANTNNAKAVAREEMKKQTLGDNFVTYTNSFEYPLLKNMIYSNFGSNDLRVYIVTANETAQMLSTEGIDVGSSKRLLVYKTDATGVQLSFVIFKTK